MLWWERYARGIWITGIYLVLLSGMFFYCMNLNRHQGYDKTSDQTNMSVQNSGLVAGKTLTIAKGDTFYKVLQNNGIAAADALEIIHSTQRVFNTAKLKPGNQLQLKFSPVSGRIMELHYSISAKDSLVVTFKDNKFFSRKAHDFPPVPVTPSERSHLDMAALPCSPLRASKQTGLGAPVTKTKSSEPGGPDVPMGNGFDVCIKKGDSLAQIVSRFGIHRSEINSLSAAAKPLYNLAGKMKPGNTLHIWLTEAVPVRIACLQYAITDSKTLLITQDNGRFSAKVKPGPIMAHGDFGGAENTWTSALTHLFAQDASGVSSSLSAHERMIMPVYASMIPMQNQVWNKQEKKHAKAGTGDDRASTDMHTVDSDWYDIQNAYPIMQKMFLTAPLIYRTISSGFSKARMHPIYNVERPHLGIDYAAPRGTPVHAVGRGRVIYKGWASGYGQTIQLRHPKGYVTYYGHLSRFAQGLKPGQEVDKGDVIGYVGSTGIATGPHLDFRVSSHGRFFDPQKLKMVMEPVVVNAHESLLNYYTSIHKDKFAHEVSARRARHRKLEVQHSSPG